MRFSTLQKTLSKTLSKTFTKTLTKTFSKTMLKATRLTTSSKLMDATRLIQRALATTLPSSTQPVPNRKSTSPSVNPTPSTPPTAARDFILVPAKSPDTDRAATAPSGKASFTVHQFEFEGNAYPYRLYVPSMPEAATGPAAKMPLVVLLHGCNQDALDFSHGTAMNRLAEDHHAMVLYPEQVASGNAMRCWNWFDPSHQQAGRGEPGMIAALVQKMAAQHHADPARTYVAGLSAGGAMAAVVANVYPQLFAAVGVHSGLAAGAAKNMIQALSAMKKGTKGGNTNAIPTIVFHGTADKTVNPSNGKYITQAALAGFEAQGVALVKNVSVINSSKNQPTERMQYSNAAGKPLVESWHITAGPHAWSGGSAQGSYTDPDGPDASKAMLAFFLQHSKGEAAR